MTPAAVAPLQAPAVTGILFFGHSWTWCVWQLFAHVDDMVGSFHKEFRILDRELGLIRRDFDTKNNVYRDKINELLRSMQLVG